MSRVCDACGNTMEAGHQFCRVCGRQASAGTDTPAPAGMSAAPMGPGETSGKAIASLIFGLFFFLFPFSIIAIVFGHLSLSEIRKSAGRLKGNGLAVAGLVLGYAGIAVIPIILIIAAIAIPNLLRARIAANEASAVSGIRSLVAAETAYATAHPDDGYTCSLPSLSEVGLIGGALARGQRNGYAFELSGCGGARESVANAHYQVVAYPLRQHQTGVRAFCSNESGIIKTDSEGSPLGCLETGGTFQ